MSSPHDAAKVWSKTEDMLLELLVLADFSHPDIALRLGRSRNAIQLRCTQKGLLLRKHRQDAKKARREAWLRQDEESLAEFLPECSEDPVVPQRTSRGRGIRIGAS